MRSEEGNGMEDLSSLLEDAKRRAGWEVVDVGLVGKGRRPPPEEGSYRGRYGEE